MHIHYTISRGLVTLRKQPQSKRTDTPGLGGCCKSHLLLSNTYMQVTPSELSNRLKKAFDGSIAAQIPEDSLELVTLRKAPGGGSGALLADVLVLSYELGRPLAALMPRRVMAQYEQISTFLFKAKTVEHKLQQSWLVSFCAVFCCFLEVVWAHVLRVVSVRIPTRGMERKESPHHVSRLPQRKWASTLQGTGWKGQPNATRVPLGWVIFKHTLEAEEQFGIGGSNFLYGRHINAGQADSNTAVLFQTA